MKKQIYTVDSNGFINNVLLGLFDKDGNLISPKGDFITTDLPQPLTFHNPKWNGREWIEGATKEEIGELTKPQPTLPTIDERIEQLENMILMMMEAM